MRKSALKEFQDEINVKKSLNRILREASRSSSRPLSSPVSPALKLTRRKKVSSTAGTRVGGSMSQGDNSNSKKKTKRRRRMQLRRAGTSSLSLSNLINIVLPRIGTMFKGETLWMLSYGISPPQADIIR
mmetsp:Transcript_37509/g.60963  ORF Transcript_37509/g.60963 Transcript_37509/m.60963 type:complete len:129 (+) Transcript_37509:377-763(+)